MTETEDHGDGRGSSRQWPARYRVRVSATRRGCVALPRVDSLRACGGSMREGSMPLPADQCGGVASSSANRRRTRADANARRWLVSRSAPPAASSARRSRVVSRAADRSDGGAVASMWYVAGRRVDAGAREFPPRGRAESGSWLATKPARATNRGVILPEEGTSLWPATATATTGTEYLVGTTPASAVAALRWRTCFAVAKLSQNAIVLTRFGFRFERKQNPRIEENLRKNVERDGSDGVGLYSPKARALPGCATPRLLRPLSLTREDDAVGAAGAGSSRGATHGGQS
jgi:hypothetical protein